MSRKRQLFVTEEDMLRLQGLLDAHGGRRDGGALDALEALLARAEVVPPSAIPGNVVTMNTRVLFEEGDTGRRREVTLVYPSEAEPARNRISVLAPVGSALLGLAVGQRREWLLPGGRARSFRVLAVLHQPEAALLGSGAAPGRARRPRRAGSRAASGAPEDVARPDAPANHPL